MKLQLDRPTVNTFTAYGEGYVSVNGVRHACNLAVLPDRLLPEWTQATFETLRVADFECSLRSTPKSSCSAPASGCAFPVPSCCARWSRAAGARSDGSAGRLPHLQCPDG
jgi:hypothetical protein